MDAATGFSHTIGIYEERTVFCWAEGKHDSMIHKHGFGFAATRLLFKELITEVTDTRFP